MCIGDEDCDCHLEDEDLGDEGDDDFDFDSDNIDGVGFAEPGGRSALRAATENNPRNRPCPTCGREDVLTPIDEMRDYICDSCADRQESNY